MKIKKRKNRKKTVNGKAYPAPFVGIVIIVVLTALVYSYLVYSCQLLGADIRVMERQRVTLKKRYVNEECRWMEEKAPAKISASLRRHNIVMTWPTSRQVVRLNIPAARKQRIASLGSRLTVGAGITGTVMND